MRTLDPGNAFSAFRFSIVGIAVVFFVVSYAIEVCYYFLGIKFKKFIIIFLIFLRIQWSTRIGSKN